MHFAKASPLLFSGLDTYVGNVLRAGCNSPPAVSEEIPEPASAFKQLKGQQIR